MYNRTLRLPIHDEIDRLGGRHIGVHEVDAVRLAWLGAQVPENGVIVEVGSFWGRSSCYLASGIKPGVHLWCVDVWPNPSDMEKFHKNVRQFGFDEVITAIHADSLMASTRFDMPIDLLYIDANHEYEYVKADYEAWSPLVKHGGTIAFHDYGHKWPGVKKFIDETVQDELQISGVYWLVWSGVKP